MAKKDHTLGKVLALTTTIAAIGGACYIFRDKIRESAIYQKSADKLSGLFGKKSDDFIDDDDFFFDDEDDSFADDTLFSEDSNNDREYTSIAINSKDEEDTVTSPLPEAEPDSDTSATEDEESPVSVDEESPVSVDAESPITAEDDALATEEETIPTITFGGGFSTPMSTPEPPTTTSSDNSEDKNEETVSAFEYEGLSDVSEDPDVLAEQDKLDF